MKRKTLILLVVLAVLFVAACTKKDNEPTKDAGTTPTVTDTPTPTEAPKDTPTPTPTEGPSEQEIWYQAILDRSVTDTGNNERLKKVIEKARAGEDVYIGFIGGSITEGEGCSYQNCYAMQTARNFQADFGNGENVHIINAGVSGTPSTLGVIRYERDLIDKNDGHKPDLLIIEFAVNDGDDPTNGKTYEGLIRRALYADNEPAVVLLFSVFQSKWNLQDRCIPIGKYYELPMVSIKDAVVPNLVDGSITDFKFFNDQYHPTMYGHTIMADCLRNLFKLIDEEETDSALVLPETPKLSSAYDNVKLITSKTEGVKITAGGFDEKDVAIGATRYDNQRIFPDNWKHTKDSGKKAFTATFNAKTILMTYKKSSQKTFGKVDVYVDGKKKTTIDGHDAGGWNNPYTVVLFEGDKVGSHKIEIKMAEGEEDKDFTIMAFGLGQ